MNNEVIEAAITNYGSRIKGIKEAISMSKDIVEFKKNKNGQRPAPKRAAVWIEIVDVLQKAEKRTKELKAEAEVQRCQWEADGAELLQLRRLKQQCEEDSSTLAALQIENIRLREVERVYEANSNIGSLQSEIQGLKNELADKTQQQELEKSAITELTESRNAFRSEASVMKRNLQAKGDELNEFEAEYATTKAALASTNEKLTNSKRENAELQNKLDNLNHVEPILTQTKTTLAETRQDLAKYKARVEELEPVADELSTTKQAHSETRSQLAAAKLRVEELQHTEDTLAKVTAKLADSNKTFTDETEKALEYTKGKLAEARDKLAKSEAELDDLRHVNTAFEDTKIKLADTRKELSAEKENNEELAYVKTDLDATKIRLQQSREKTAAMEEKADELAYTQKTLESTKEKLAKIRDERTTAEETIQTRDDTIKALNKTLDTANSKAEACEVRVAAVEAELTVAKASAAENKSLKRDLAVLQKFRRDTDESAEGIRKWLVLRIAREAKRMSEAAKLSQSLKRQIVRLEAMLDGQAPSDIQLSDDGEEREE